MGSKGDWKQGIHRSILTSHARRQLERRGIDEMIVRSVLTTPERTQEIRAGRQVFQAMYDNYLYRVFVDIDRDPPEIVTAYRTSKIDKYRK